jgi:two-component system KDP operon response regulator KdpE
MLRAVEAGLQARGYLVQTARDGHEALALCSRVVPDVVLLDLGLPDLDGIEVCRHLRRWTKTPIIVLTADGAEDRKISALDQGADDYLTKPFSMPELHARVRVAIRHRSDLAPMIDGAILEVGGLRVDVGAHMAFANGSALELTRRQFALLSLLALNCGKVLTNRYILEQVWGPDQLDNISSVRTHILALRRRITGDGLPSIVTETGVGYRMLHP